ncbi:MAG: hypothetical protein H0X14_10890 [Acidobacteria bacterium]|nr:hypothetical protein [Acidobacteriota bacterium]
MKSFYRISGTIALLVALLASATLAQRPRTVNDPAQAPMAQTTAAPMTAPQTVNANYEGGVFGYNKRINGTLTFDDTNSRLLFRNKQQQEVLFIPYAAVLSAFADTQAKRPVAASVLGSIVPYGLGLPALLWKKKFRYLTLQYRDPDTNAAGVTSFKMENKQTLEAVLNTLAAKAGLTQRGEVFVRRKDPNDQP